MRHPIRLLLVAASLAACADGGAPGPSVERTDSAGVEIVLAPGLDVELGARFAPAFYLGGRETGPDSFYRVSSGLVGVDREARIHVLDPDAHRIVVFDGDGRHLWSAGRQGDGPGELGRPVSLVVTPDGESLVLDFADMAFDGFRDGEPSGSRPIPFPFFGGRTDVQGEDLLLLRGGAADAVQLLVRVTPAGDTSVVRSRQGAPTSPLDLRESCGIAISGMAPLFDPPIVWDARDGLLAVAPDGTYRVEVYDGEELVRVLRRDLPLRPAGRADARTEVGDAMRVGTPGGERVCDADEVVEQRGFLPELPWIEGLRIAPDGGVWVERLVPGPETVGPVDLFDPSGAYVGTLPAGTGLPLAFLPDGRVVLRDEDEATGLERIVVGRMELGEGEGG